MNQEEKDFICTGSMTPICPGCLEKINILQIPDSSHKCEYCGEVFTIIIHRRTTYSTKKQEGK